MKAGEGEGGLFRLTKVMDRNEKKLEANFLLKMQIPLTRSIFCLAKNKFAVHWQENDFFDEQSVIFESTSNLSFVTFSKTGELGRPFFDRLLRLQ
jgi:hypothetical protein